MSLHTDRRTGGHPGSLLLVRLPPVDASRVDDGQGLPGQGLPDAGEDLPVGPRVSRQRRDDPRRLDRGLRRGPTAGAGRAGRGLDEPGHRRGRARSVGWAAAGTRPPGQVRVARQIANARRAGDVVLVPAHRGRSFDRVRSAASWDAENHGPRTQRPRS